MDKTTECIRCDTEVSTEWSKGLILLFRQNTKAVKLCDDCKEIAEQRDFL